MGLLQEGKWVDRWYQTKDTGGRFVRKSASFRNWITADGSAGPSGVGGFQAEKETLSFICISGLPMGPPNIDF